MSVGNRSAVELDVVEVSLLQKSKDARLSNREKGKELQL